MLSVSHRPGHTISLVKSQDRIYHLRRALMLPLLTGIQQQFHHGEVWMWNTVVERHVPVAVCQIDDVWQQSGRGQTHLAQVRSDGVGLGVLLTGHPEPLLIEGYQDLTLARRDEDVTVKAELVAVLLLFLNVFFKGIDGVKRLAFAGWTIALFTLYYCPHWSLKTKRNENNKRRKRGCKKNKINLSPSETGTPACHQSSETMKKCLLPFLYLERTPLPCDLSRRRKHL